MTAPEIRRKAIVGLRQAAPVDETRIPLHRLFGMVLFGLFMWFAIGAGMFALAPYFSAVAR